MDKKSAQARLEAISKAIEARLPKCVDRHEPDWMSVVGGKHGISHLHVAQKGGNFRLEATLGTQFRLKPPGTSPAMMAQPIDVTNESDEDIVRRILGE